MRHFLSVVLSLILTPLMYAASGFAAVKLQLATATGSISWGAASVGILVAIAAGAMYAVLVMARLSPVGPVLAGLLLLGVTLWAMVKPLSFTDALPATFLGEKGALYAPVGAGTLLLAVPLLVTIFSPRRWRRYADVGASATSAAPAYPTQATSAAPTYGATTYQPPAYASMDTTAPTYAQSEPVTAASTTAATPTSPASWNAAPVYTPASSTTPAYTPVPEQPTAPTTPEPPTSE